MHQDHGQNVAVCQGAINLGFSSVMMDGSLEGDGKTIASYEYNVEVTRKVVDLAHATGVTVEGELGCLGSLDTMKGDKEDGHGTDATMTRDQMLTNPEQAADFVKRTQLDALAIAIGTSHGAYKFTRKPTGEMCIRDSFSHGKAQDHIDRARLVREAAKRAGREVAIMADLQGPKIRVGKFLEGKVFLEPGQSFVLDASRTELGDINACLLYTSRCV